MSFLVIRERYHHGNGILYRVDARIKLLIAMLFAVGVTMVPEGHWLAFAGFASFAFLAMLLSRVPAWLILRRSIIALPFVAAALPLVFTRYGEPIFAVPVLGWNASIDGIVAVASIVLKSYLAVLVAVVLTACTPPIDLIRGLERLRLPRVLSTTIFFMYRYLFVIGEEGQRMIRAREARSSEHADVLRSGGNLPWRARVVGNMVGTLFVRSVDRSERIYAAMQARGYDGMTRISDEQPLSREDWHVFVVTVVLLGGLLAYARF